MTESESSGAEDATSLSPSVVVSSSSPRAGLDLSVGSLHRDETKEPRLNDGVGGTQGYSMLQCHTVIIDDKTKKQDNVKPKLFTIAADDRLDTTCSTPCDGGTNSEDGQSTEWFTFLQAMVNYKNQNQTYRVPRDYVQLLPYPNDTFSSSASMKCLRLGEWVASLWQQYALWEQGQSISSLTRQRLQMLTQIGFFNKEYRGEEMNQVDAFYDGHWDCTSVHRHVSADHEDFSDSENEGYDKFDEMEVKDVWDKSFIQFILPMIPDPMNQNIEASKRSELNCAEDFAAVRDKWISEQKKAYREHQQQTCNTCQGADDDDDRAFYRATQSSFRFNLLKLFGVDLDAAKGGDLPLVEEV